MILDFRTSQGREEGARILSLHRSPGTHLISLYVSKNPVAALQRIRSQESRLGNIKSKATQKSVERALARVILQLKCPPDPPFVIFASEEVSYVCILPPTLAKDDYVCDKVFDYQGLLDHAESRWGLVVSDTLETTIGSWQNGRIRVIGRYQYFIPGKIKAGGQSSQRFQETRMKRYAVMIDDVTARINEAFAGGGYAKIFIGGTSPTNERLMSSPDIDQRIKPLLVGPFSIGYTNAEGLSLLVKRISEDCADLLQEYRQEETTFKAIIDRLSRGNGGGLDQYRGVPLNRPRFYLVKGVDYRDRFCPVCSTYDYGEFCTHPTIPLSSVPEAYSFRTGQNADFIREKYHGLVTHEGHSRTSEVPGK